MAKAESRRIAVLGAGPIGLEAALYGRRLGFAVTVYERGQVADSLRRWGHVRLFTPFEWNSTPLGRAALRGATLPGDNDCITGVEHANSYLAPLAQSELLKGCIQTETQVIQVGKSGVLKTDADINRGDQPFRLLVRKGQTERIDEADIVVDCTGTYTQHRWMGEGGIPAVGELASEPNLCYQLDDILGAKKAQYASKSILLVGSGYSGATSACLLARLAEQHPDMWVVWLARGSRKQPLPRIPNDSLKERDRLAVRANSLATRGDGNLEFHPHSTVQTVEWRNNAFRVVARVNGKERTWEVDRVIANVGYMPDTNLYRELQVQENASSQDGVGPRTGEPNFFILGAKSFGRDSQFLLRTGFEQVRDVFGLITGEAALDLYKGAK